MDHLVKCLFLLIDIHSTLSNDCMILARVIHDIAARGEPRSQGGDVHVDRQPAVHKLVRGRQPLDQLPSDVEGLRAPLVHA